MTIIDKRLLAARPDIAAAHLRGLVEAPHFVEGRLMRVSAFAAPVRRAPRRDAPLDTEALHGEEVVVYDVDDEGWAWGQLVRDGYVGYLPADDLTAGPAPASHVVAVPRTLIYPLPDMKQPPIGALPLGARLLAGEARGDFLRVGDGFVFARHLRGVDAHVSDPAGIAERLRGVPYLWGGKSALGLDCSALVQLSLGMAGLDCLRDSDLQAADVSLGRDIAVSPEGAVLPEGVLAGLSRGDLVFWKGHVGMMLDAQTLIHANAHHMMVEIEPLHEAVARIKASGGGGITRLKAMGFGGA